MTLVLDFAEWLPRTLEIVRTEYLNKYSDVLDATVATAPFQARGSSALTIHDPHLRIG